MNRVLVTIAMASTAVLAACGGSEVVVQAQVQGTEGQALALRELPIRALPYDRDVVFDSLRDAYDTPEPEIPADLSSLQDSIAAAQQTWRNAEARWNAGRDSLRTIKQQLDELNPASGQYVVLFREFSALEGDVAGAERTSREAFRRFTSLQNRYASQADETRRAREQWADAAYADIDRVIDARLRESRLTEHADTTNQNGIARFRGLKKGNWWIHARYDLPFEELYWNVPITVDGEDVQVQLTRENAEVRPKL